jgi:hypothetical protein
MADIAQALASKLNATSGVTALIGTRSYPSWDRPNDHVYPLAVWEFDISDIVAFDGVTDLGTAVLNIAAIGRTYAEAAQVGEAIKSALEGVGTTWGTVTVQGCFLQDNGVRDSKFTDPSTEAVTLFIKEYAFDLAYTS